MAKVVNREGIYVPSKSIVAREIQGVIVIVPITLGVTDLEEELFTLNETGKDIWKRLDGHHTLHDVISELATEYDAPEAELAADVQGLVEELARRKMIVEVLRG